MEYTKKTSVHHILGKSRMAAFSHFSSSSFCFITFFNGFFGAGIAGEAIVDRNGKWPLARSGERFLGVELGITFPEATRHGFMRPGRSSLWGYWVPGHLGPPGVKNNKGVADQFGERGIPSKFWETEELWKNSYEGVVPSTFLLSKWDTPRKSKMTIKKPTIKQDVYLL